MRILIIEDEEKTVKFLSKGLKEEGYTVSLATDGETGYEMALNDDYDAIILDIMLPQRDGLSVCKMLRQEGRKIPILMLTARETIDNRIEGLDAGADDYLIKPFAFGELTARLRSLIRRKGETQTNLELGGLGINLMTHKVSYQGKEIDLTSREYALLQLFMRRKGHILSRSQIADSAWGYDFDSETNVIDVYVTFLRKKLNKATGKEWIKTHRSRGYCFEEPAV